MTDVGRGFADRIKSNLRNRLGSSSEFAERLVLRAEKAAEAAAALYVARLAGVEESSLELQTDALEARMSAIKAAGGIRLAKEVNGAIADVRKAAWLAVGVNLEGIDEVENTPDEAEAEAPPLS